MRVPLRCLVPAARPRVVRGPRWVTKRNTPSDQVRFCLFTACLYGEQSFSGFVFFLLQRTQIFVVSISKQLLIVVYDLIPETLAVMIWPDP